MRRRKLVLLVEEKSQVEEKLALMVAEQKGKSTKTVDIVRRGDAHTMKTETCTNLTNAKILL